MAQTDTHNVMQEQKKEMWGYVTSFTLVNIILSYSAVVFVGRAAPEPRVVNYVFNLFSNGAKKIYFRNPAFYAAM
jgi:hypothetical protein